METSIQVNQEPQIGFFARLGNLFAAPSRVFAQLREKPDLVWPLIFFAVIVGLSLYQADFYQKLMMDSFPKLGAQLSQAQLNNSPAMVVVKVVSSIVSLLISWCLLTGFYYLAAKILGGEKVRFLAFFLMFGYTNIAEVLKSVFQSGVLALTGTLPPVGLETGMELSDRFFTTKGILLSAINPFAVFGIILIVIALEKAFRISRAKAVAIAMVFWIVTTAISGLSVSTYAKFR